VKDDNVPCAAVVFVILRSLNNFEHLFVFSLESVWSVVKNIQKYIKIFSAFVVFVIPRVLNNFEHFFIFSLKSICKCGYRCVSKYFLLRNILT